VAAPGPRSPPSEHTKIFITQLRASAGHCARCIGVATDGRLRLLPEASRNLLPTPRLQRSKFMPEGSCRGGGEGWSLRIHRECFAHRSRHRRESDTSFTREA
jgi:hypothetical protein